jgi:hypothetical protein
MSKPDVEDRTKCTVHKWYNSNCDECLNQEKMTQYTQYK